MKTAGLGLLGSRQRPFSPQCHRDVLTRNYLHRGPVYGWLVERQVDLGSSEASGTHALVVDRPTGQAWIAPLPVARALVRRQTVAVGEVLP